MPPLAAADTAARRATRSGRLGEELKFQALARNLCFETALEPSQPG